MVDNQDYSKLQQNKWHCSKTGYAQARMNHKIVSMHTCILGFVNGEIDHINGNKLDNRRKNLRIVTRSQNMANCGLRSNNTSGYKGVHWRKDLKKWCAQIKHNYIWYGLGVYKSRIAAAKVYNKAARKFFGKYAWLNQI